MTTMTPASSAPQATPEQVEELAGRLFNAGLNATDVFTIHMGVVLGLYKALDEHGPEDSTSLAKLTGLSERYVREWLQGQATTGLLVPDGQDVTKARFSLAPG